jgi:hypothetical protein
MTILWIVAGPKITRRGALTGRVTQVDTAATALYVLGLSLPTGCAGEVVREAFASP